jgi:hypothetical protein
VALSLGGRSVRLFLESCGVSAEAAAGLCLRLGGESAALDRGGGSRLLWSLRFSDERAARRFAEAWGSCLERRHPGVRPGEDEGSRTWAGGTARVSLTGAVVLLEERTVDDPSRERVSPPRPPPSSS